MLNSFKLLILFSNLFFWIVKDRLLWFTEAMNIYLHLSIEWHDLKHVFYYQLVYIDLQPDDKYLLNAIIVNI